MFNSRQRHDIIVDDLTNKLIQENKSHKVIPYFTFSGQQVDILEYWRDHNIFYFNNYEIQEKDSPFNYAQAENHLYRLEKYIKRTFQGALSYDSINNFYVVGKGVDAYQVCKLGEKQGLEYKIG